MGKLVTKQKTEKKSKTVCKKKNIPKKIFLFFPLFLFNQVDNKTFLKHLKLQRRLYMPSNKNTTEKSPKRVELTPVDPDSSKNATFERFTNKILTPQKYMILSSLTLNPKQRNTNIYHLRKLIDKQNF